MRSIEDIRKDFPQFSDPSYHYLDSAATSLAPNQVLDAMNAYYTNYRANVHRGLFAEAVRATDEYEAARAKVAAFIGAQSSAEVMFTSGATESSNMLVRMFEHSFAWKGKKIVTSEMEHHSTLVPLQEFAKRAGTTLAHIPLLGLGLNYDEAEKLIDKDTALVSVMLASNVTGVINDIARISGMAHVHGALVVVDATAAAGHIPLDVAHLGVDFIYFSGHKMLGPTGIGVLWGKKELLEKMEPSSYGGHMVARVEKDTAEWAGLPERFEAGTKNIAGAIGLGAAVDYLCALNIGDIHQRVASLAVSALEQLSAIEGVHIISPTDSKMNVGIAAFHADWAHPHDIAEVLARDRVGVRAGHHCAMPVHTALKIGASTRASFHVYNTTTDVDALVNAVLKARAVFVP